jgi:hypothetical protein
MTIENLLQSFDDAKSSNTYETRIKTLNDRGQNTGRIEKGIADVEAVLASGAKSFVIYGEPQSGKTEFMIALTCKLIDRGFRTIFIVMNDNTELEVQNFERFRSATELNPSPLRDTQIVSMPEDQLKKDKPRIVFCRKNARNLKKLIDCCRFMKERIVIDDEADYASPNTKINKKELTAINQYLGNLGKLHEGDGHYIGVTATPGRLDLNNTYANDSTKWVFLDSYDSYKGRRFFFPQSANEVNTSNYTLNKLPDQSDDPRLLRSALLSFLVRVAILNIGKETEPTAYSMLIHTAGKTLDHEQDQEAVEKIFSILEDASDKRRYSYWDELSAIAEKLVGKYELKATGKDLLEFVYNRIGQREILIINSKNDGDNMSKSGNPRALFTIAIGGNIVSRGVTFERLLSFYFSRNVRGRLQQNTYIQRARMFGNRPYSKFFELSVPEQLFEDWAQLFQDHELSLRLARAGNYAHIQSDSNLVSDSAAIDRKNVEVSQSEHTVGEIFDLNPKLEEKLLAHDRISSVTFIKDLIESGLMPSESIHPEIIGFISETCASNQSDVLIVLRNEKNGKRAIQNIGRYDDGDTNTLTRARGGIIHAILNKSDDYVTHKHFLLPIKNDEGKIRFIYKSKLGRTIFRNVIDRR